jgi:hypothetical protein
MPKRGFVTVTIKLRPDLVIKLFTSQRVRDAWHWIESNMKNDFGYQKALQVIEAAYVRGKRVGRASMRDDVEKFLAEQGQGGPGRPRK